MQWESRDVHSRKIVLGLLVRETFVPQSYAWGVEAQIDWYEAYADLAGERVKLQVFAMLSKLRPGEKIVQACPGPSDVVADTVTQTRNGNRSRGSGFR